MKNLKFIFSIFLIFIFLGKDTFAQDWANLNRFSNENEKLGLPASGESRVVFMGNSITEGWAKVYPDFFSGKPYINRGISGQTTPQMLIRFRTDVIELRPKVVVILAGTNDIAGNTGPSTLKMLAGNIISMAELAKANGIKIILCSVLPVFDYPWKPGLKPAEKIVTLNELIKNYADQNGIIFLDYYASTVDDRKGLKAGYSADGVHPNAAGYKIMATLTEEALAKAFNQK